VRCNIVPIASLLPLEQVFPVHLKNLGDMIDDSGIMMKALIVDIEDGIILDGSHRYAYLLSRGFKEAPVYLVDYDDENIRVGSRLLHKFLIKEGEDVKISKQICREHARSGSLFPPRTTRHFFPFRKADISLPLGRLVQGRPVSVDHLVSDADINEEINHNRSYIEEISEEYEAIIQYLSEVAQTKKYLEDQVLKMSNSKKIAFFPGKFQPPHIGHVQTLLRLMPYYKKIIIGVTEHRVDDIDISLDDIKAMLSSFLKSFEHVEICEVEGVLTEKEDLRGLPEFDVLLSGNKEVLRWAEEHGVEAKFVHRSEGLFCSGTEMRLVIKEGVNA